jgi:23S rRNA A1618 N6-methylase RlmF
MAIMPVLILPIRRLGYAIREHQHGIRVPDDLRCSPIPERLDAV